MRAAAQAFDGGETGRRGRGEQLVTNVGLAGHFPGEAAQGHAAVDDGNRPDVDGLRIVLVVVVDFRR